MPDSGLLFCCWLCLLPCRPLLMIFLSLQVLFVKLIFSGQASQLGCDIPLLNMPIRIPNLKAGAFTSEVRVVTTPFTQVAEYSSRTISFLVMPDALKISSVSQPVLMYLDICPMTNAPPNAVKVKVIQNRKEITSESEDRSAYYPATDEYTRMPSIGEQLQLRFNAEKIDSSALTIEIDTPDGQHARLNSTCGLSGEVP